MDYPRLVPGILIRRYKRFLADVRLDDGREVVAHCPNTGSMRAVNVPGARVWLSSSDNPKRKLSWTWELIALPQPGGGTALASVHTGRTNAIVGEALRAGSVAPLAGFSELKREVRVEGARLDFRLAESSADAGSAAYVEVKQVTLRETDGHGYFPDAVSERGRRHLEVLSRLACEGQRAVLLFCVAHTGIDDVAPAAHIDPGYAQALGEAVAAGVEVLAYGCEIDWQRAAPAAIRLARPLPVSLTRQVDAALVVDGEG
ncbi:sugar fermentation stimulation protein A [Onishia taeanensis]|uniref:Sugar fermentation stimulation protein homolog n=1 Tax=Onishia taeanensis TaxID=284577 RepID=A0A328XK62_9GAMM|nr:DNA/RNA nuclease SfsA [Halomonas taeanensis]RAR58530.1 sugar fermentation stimulation protein A [Halomonas taeanensis]